MTTKAKKLIMGDKVRRARVRAGMTQKALSDAVGIAQSHICEIEAGNRGLKAEQLYFIAIATKKPLEYFVR
jgi:hypothetical protein